MKQIVGYERKTGSMVAENGKTINYDNIVLHVLSDEDIKVIGKSAAFVKVPSKLFPLPFLSDVKSLLGKEVFFNYSLDATPRLLGVNIK